MRAGRKPASAFGAVAAAMVMTTVLASSALASSAVGDTGFGEIAVSNSNKCLDVRAQDGFYSPGARVQQWDCSGVPEQQWQLHPYATVPSPYNPAVSVTLYQIQSERSGLCMEVGGGGFMRWSARAIAEQGRSATLRTSCLSPCPSGTPPIAICGHGAALRCASMSRTAQTITGTCSSSTPAPAAGTRSSTAFPSFPADRQALRKGRSSTQAL